MDLFNPVSLFFLFAAHSVNLYQMDRQLAADLSGRYVREAISENISPSGCPLTFNIELITSNATNIFFLKDEARFSGSFDSHQRILPVDGRTHILGTGQLVRAEVTDPSTIDVQTFNREVPSERILQTFRFNADGSIEYESQFVDHDSLRVADVSRTLCEGSRYKRIDV